MRDQEKWGYFAVLNDNGHIVACHAHMDHAPAGSKPISDAERSEIEAATTQRTTSLPAIVQTLSEPPDLKPLLDRIDALSKEVLAQAQALDEANSKISGQASDIAKVRENTAKAIAQMTEGIGEQKA
ncbi:hypothetical protein [Hyphomicrobium sp. MC1]|uniref:hypothetical protein n=1 Tax=Hyphomicrobium sp. (strain MC1) TaxID=717785 RepID=UPI000213DCD8|nr:hypothetical protein [Hyphomicrobium sp. MC1]CCB64481.1 protein of unknown function [Hyphomicrobium sp. MC1]